MSDRYSISVNKRRGFIILIRNTVKQSIFSSSKYKYK